MAAARAAGLAETMNAGTLVLASCQSSCVRESDHQNSDLRRLELWWSAATFFCGGSRNSDRFIGLFDEVFVLEVDLDTLNRRLAARPENEWGGTASEGKSFARLQHETKEGLPENAIIIDATTPLSSIVDTIEFIKIY